MSMASLKENLKEILSDAIESGATGAIMVGPSGFPVSSFGNVKEKDMEAATVFAASLDNLSISDKFSKNLTFLLGKKAQVGKAWISELAFQYGNTTYIGAFVRGFTVLALLREKKKIQTVRAELMRSVGSIITLFEDLAGE